MIAALGPVIADGTEHDVPTGMVRVENGAFGSTKIGTSPRLARDS